MSATPANSISQLLAQYSIRDNKSEIFSEIRNSLRNKSGGYYAALNPGKIISALDDEKVHQILLNANFLFIDGVGARMAYSILLGRKVKTVPGIDLMLETIGLSSQMSLRIGLFGSEESSVQKASENLRKEYPNVEILFAVDGYASGREQVGRLIEELKPQIVFVALGSPHQERWIFEHFKSFPATLFTGVGGSLDVISGKTPRANQCARKLGLEWLFRSLLEPRKRWMQVLTRVRFSFLVIKDRLAP